MEYPCGLDYLNKLIDQDLLTINDFALRDFFKDWDSFKNVMSDFILPPSSQNIVNNCKLVKVTEKATRLLDCPDIHHRNSIILSSRLL